MNKTVTYDVFNEWDPSKYPNNAAKLDAIKNVKGDYIILTNYEGSRGVDYKMAIQAFVIIGLKPTLW